jgi:hypothetical protein
MRSDGCGIEICEIPGLRRETWGTRLAHGWGSQFFGGVGAKRKWSCR